MITKFYIDESGNSGDLIMTEDNIDFSSQQYFTLACIGFEDEILSDLETFITDLKIKYKIQTPKLKFSKIKHIFGKKIGFVLELIKHIEENSSFLIEVVDKKYFISTNIVNCLINPPYFQPEIEMKDQQDLHQLLSQWVCGYVSTDFFINFSNIARNPSKIGLEKLFKDLLNIAKRKNDDLSNAVVKAINESIDDYQRMKNDVVGGKREAYTYFLPSPDYNKRGELIGILPHISSFTNLHARLNAFYGDDLSLITLIHDNQDHFDDIIKQYHQNSINKENEFDKVFEMTNFKFSCISHLEFHDDKNKIGLQVADIFAGLINKSISYIVNKESYLIEKEYSILLQILTSLYYQKSINFVLPMNVNYDIIFPLLDKRLNYNLLMAFNGKDKDYIDNLLLQT